MAYVFTPRLSSAAQVIAWWASVLTMGWSLEFNFSSGRSGLSIPHNPLGRQELFCPVCDNDRDAPPRLYLCRLLPRDSWSSTPPTGPLPAGHATERRWRWQGVRVPYAGEHEEVQ